MPSAMPRDQYDAILLDLDGVITDTATMGFEEQRPHNGPTALKLRPDLIEGVESSLYFRFHIWPWQLVAKMATKVVCQTLKTGQRCRFLAKKEIGVIEASTSNVCNTSFNNEIELVRCYRSFSAAGPI